MRRALLFVLWGYKKLLSPMLPSACRFTPTCSEFAMEAVAHHGAAKGAWLAMRRIARCHPLHAGGFDPVPHAVSIRSHFHNSSSRQAH